VKILKSQLATRFTMQNQGELTFEKVSPAHLACFPLGSWIRVFIASLTTQIVTKIGAKHKRNKLQKKKITRAFLAFSFWIRVLIASLTKK